jgi:hypothetical protein
VAVAEAGTGRQLQDPLLQEAEAQMKDSLAGEGELCGLEVQARRLGEHGERQANADAGPSERRPRVMIRGDQIYVGRTRLNPKKFQNPLMALRPVIPLRTIVDQILMECWKERQPIKRENHDCDYCRDPYRRGEGACGEPTKAFKSRRPLRIHYDRGLNNAERYAAFLRHAYDENEAVQGEGYAVSDDSFDPSESSSSGADRDREQRELNDYAESMPSRPGDYISHEDTSSDSGNGFENLCRD